MKKYTSLKDIKNLSDTIQKAIQLKEKPYQFADLGQHKTLVMLFFNASLRTRLSTEKAAKNLGMEVSVLNITNAWNMEFEDDTVKNIVASTVYIFSSRLLTYLLKFYKRTYNHLLTYPFKS